MYIDPNTGGILFQALAGIVAAVSGVLFFFSRQIRESIARFRRRAGQDARQGRHGHASTGERTVVDRKHAWSRGWVRLRQIPPIGRRAINYRRFEPRPERRTRSDLHQVIDRQLAPLEVSGDVESLAQQRLQLRPNVIPPIGD